MIFFKKTVNLGDLSIWETYTRTGLGVLSNDLRLLASVFWITHDLIQDSSPEVPVGKRKSTIAEETLITVEVLNITIRYEITITSQSSGRLTF